MNDADAGYDSSDFEDLPPSQSLPTEFSSAGKALVNAINSNAEFDRKASKRAVRSIDFQYGAPGSRRKQKYIENVATAYFSSIGKDPSQCPTAEDIKRFVATLAARIKTRIRGKEVASLCTVQSWLKLFELYGIFTWGRAFRYVYDDQLRLQIKAFLDQEVRKGNLFRGRWFKQQWLGFMTLKLMATNYLESAIKNGCRSWDVILLQVLTVALQSACSCRSGDIARSNSWTGEEFLKWEDIVLDLPAGKTNLQDLRCIVTLKYEKDYKSDINDDRVVCFEPLADSAHFPLCVVRLLLIHALRQGLCHGTTLQDVLNHTATQPYRQVAWKHPRFPVLCAGQEQRRSFLTVDQPAMEAASTRAVKAMALVSGIVDRVVSHSIRAGAARDIANLKTTPTGVSAHSVREALGHSRFSYGNGVTDRYVGDNQTPYFNLRAESDFDDRLRPRIDPSAASHQRFGGVRAPLMPIPNQVDPRITDGDSPQKSTGNGTTRKRSASRADQARPPKKFSPNDGPAAPAIKKDPALVEDAMTELPPERLVLDDVDIVEIDEAEFAGLQGIIEQPHDGPKEEDDIPVDDLSDNEASANSTVISTLFAGPGGADQQLWPTDGASFIDYFARINVYRLEVVFDRTNMDLVRKYVPMGNSRQTPTSYEYSCRKGCSYSTDTQLRMLDHETSCQGANVDDLEAFPCPYEDCPSVCHGKKAFYYHLHGIHNFEPRTCTHGCDDGQVFHTQAEWQQHRLTFHDDYQPRNCPLMSDCHSSTIYKTRVTLASHLGTVHQLTGADRAEYLPHKASNDPEPFTPTGCIVAGCPTLSTFTEAWGLRHHLKYTHRMAHDEIQRLVPRRGRSAFVLQPGIPPPPPPPPSLAQCPVPNCTSKSKGFDGVGKLRAHLMGGQHKMSKEEATELAEQTTGKKVRNVLAKGLVQPRKCPLDNSHSTLHSVPSQLRMHLMDKHQLSHSAATQEAERVFGQPIRARGGFRSEATVHDEDDD